MALDPRYRLSVSPSELKENVGKLLQMEVKRYSRCEDRQRGESTTYQPPKNTKPQSSTNSDSKHFLSSYSFETRKTESEENEQ